MTDTYTLKFFNTLSRKKEVFTPREDPEVTLYTCGPTVYHYAHIGNLRTYVFEDLLRRTLEFFGKNVTQVMNITDVDDKTIREALKNKVSLEDYTKPFTEAFFEDLKALSIQPAAFYPKATDYIQDMIKMIEQLVDKGVAYVGQDHSVYFSIEKFPNYGALSRLDQSKLKSNASGRLNDEYDKDSVSDFVLWKAYDASRDGDIFWDSPFGKGRPGWHIECSAMALTLLGPEIDIHCGGVDNIFPHHENEIAQSECVCSKSFARFWMHSEHLLVENRKMAKSAGNFFTLRDLMEKGYSAREVRFLLLQAHYRTQLNFTLDGLEGARSSLERLDDLVYRLQNTSFEEGMDLQINQDIEDAMNGFTKALADDLNVSEALSSVYTLVKKLNTYADEKKLKKGNAEQACGFFEKANSVLALLNHEEESFPKEVLELLEKRQQARKDKDWALADACRDEIDARGYSIEDSPQGVRLKAKKGAN